MMLFLFMIWGTYGIADMIPVIEKNIFYNCLDIISKNFYGLYIFYKILQVKETYKYNDYNDSFISLTYKNKIEI